MALPFDDDDLKHVRLGRFSDADERLVRRIMGPWFLRAHTKGRSRPSRGPSKRTKDRDREFQVLLSRGNTVARGYGHPPRRQAIVKVGFCPKSRNGVMRQALYITRRRPQDLTEEHYKAIAVWDGFGQPIEDGDIFAIAEKWQLPNDEENLSKKARNLLAEGRAEEFRALGGRERLRNIQTWHFIFSVEEDGGHFTPFRAAVRRTIDTAFTADGYQSIWAVHANTDHLHAHVIVKAQSELGGRLHSDIRGDYLQWLRETFAGSLRQVGLDYEATRRVDRRWLRDDVMAGLAPLRDAKKPWRQSGEGADLYASLSSWPQIYGPSAMESLRRIDGIRTATMEATQQLSGLDKVARATDILRERLDQYPKQASRWRAIWPAQKGQADSGSLSKFEWELIGHLKNMFFDPKQALESWRLMASDGAYRGEKGAKVCPNRALAIWYFQHRPELFGLTKVGAYQIDDFRQLQRHLKKVRLWALEQLPRREQNDNKLSERIWQKTIQKNRAGTLSDLAKLQARLDRIWPDSGQSHSVAEAIGQASKIQIERKQPHGAGIHQGLTATTSRTSAMGTPENDNGDVATPGNQMKPLNPRPIVVRKGRNTRSSERGR